MSAVFRWTAVVAALACVSCVERSEPADTTADRVRPDTVAQSIQQPAPVSVPAAQPAMTQSVEPLATEKLAAALPATLVGVKGLEPSMGTMSAPGGARWTTASRDYPGADGLFTVAITDYTDIAQKLAELEQELVVPTDPGLQSTPFSTAAGRGLVVWNVASGEGRLVFILNNRFEVRITTPSLPSNVSGLRRVFDALPLRTLAKQ